MDTPYGISFQEQDQTITVLKGLGISGHSLRYLAEDKAQDPGARLDRCQLQAIYQPGTPPPSPRQQDDVAGREISREGHVKPGIPRGAAGAGVVQIQQQNLKSRQESSLHRETTAP